MRLKTFKGLMVFGITMVGTTARGALYFSTSGDDLIITARESLSGPDYWSMTLSGLAAATPADGAGLITQFHDLTGAAGSDPTFNLTQKAGLLETRMRAGGNAGNPLNGPTIAPAVGSLLEEVDTYSFSRSGTYVGGVAGSATMISTYTITSPTALGTRFTVEQTLVTTSDWEQPTNPLRDSTSVANTYLTGNNMVTSAYNGWADSPKNSTQWASATATANSIHFADGRSFLLTQIADATTIATATPNYANATASDTQLFSYEQLSGSYKGTMDPGATYTSTITLDININTVPEPTAGIFVGLFGLAALRRRKTARA